ncbi:alpha/beta hydrolase [bacterium LRH843]|nr:alpha/beta hydrolase [bacterium LRH843]
MDLAPNSIRFDSNRLSGAIHYPDHHNKKQPAIIFVHGFIGSKVGAHRLFIKAANHFTKLGYVSFRFDFSGCGESVGDYQNVTVTEQIKELQAAITYVSGLKGVDSDQIVLIGHSLGGAVTALTAALVPQVKQIVLWSPVARPYLDISTITGMEVVETANRDGVCEYYGFLLSETFFTDLKAHHPLKTISLYEGKTLIVHAENDEDVPKANAVRYLSSIHSCQQDQPIDVAYIYEADHTFTRSHWQKELFQISSNWLQNVVESRKTVEVV